MATVFMKWLETSPKDYDRGIQILTLGRLARLRKQIAEYVFPGARVLEIGCGTGALAALMAEQGAAVTAVDASPRMLAAAQSRIRTAGLGGRVRLERMDATSIGQHFPPASFDLIVAALVFSELSEYAQHLVLESCAGPPALTEGTFSREGGGGERDRVTERREPAWHAERSHLGSPTLPYLGGAGDGMAATTLPAAPGVGLLAPGGRLLMADEIVPIRPLACLVYYLVRAPLALLTWLLTRTSTKPLRDFERLASEVGFEARRAASYLGGSLVLYETVALRSPTGDRAPTDGPVVAAFAAPPAVSRESRALESPATLQPGTGVITPAPILGTLRHRVTIRTLLIDLWCLLFRIIPPYPRVRPGLYAVGRPGRRSPVLVTGNFVLTVRSLVRALDGQVDAWLLVADSAGINVWCAAGGGFFTAEKVIAALNSTHLAQVVDHHALILPQLCANGVDGWRVRHETGWGVHWGPVRAADVPAYLAAGRQKTDAMRQVRFPLRDRLEMVTVTLGFYGLLILLPVLIFWRSLVWPVTVSLIALSFFYAAVHPWLPGRDGLAKSLPLVLVALGGLAVYAWLGPAFPAPRFFRWAVGLTGLSVFTAAELQGMSPLMRGEQANWGYEAVIAVALGLIYWLVPLAVGWR